MPQTVYTKAEVDEQIRAASGGSSVVPILKPSGGVAQDTAELKAMLSEPVIQLVPGAGYQLGDFECSHTGIRGWGLDKNHIEMKGTPVFNGGNIRDVSMTWAGAPECLVLQATGGKRIQWEVDQFRGVKVDNGATCTGTAVLVRGDKGVVQNIRFGPMVIHRCRKGLHLWASGTGAWVNDLKFEQLMMWACREFITEHGDGVECASNHVMSLIMQPDAIAPVESGIKLLGLARYAKFENVEPWDWNGNKVKGMKDEQTGEKLVARTLDIGAGAIKGKFEGGWQNLWIDRAGNGSLKAGGYYETAQGNKVYV